MAAKVSIKTPGEAVGHLGSVASPWHGSPNGHLGIPVLVNSWEVITFSRTPIYYLLCIKERIQIEYSQENSYQTEVIAKVPSQDDAY